MSIPAETYNEVRGAGIRQAVYFMREMVWKFAKENQDNQQKTWLAIIGFAPDLKMNMRAGTIFEICYEEYLAYNHGDHATKFSLHLPGLPGQGPSHSAPHGGAGADAEGPGSTQADEHGDVPTGTTASQSATTGGKPTAAQKRRARRARANTKASNSQ